MSLFAPLGAGAAVVGIVGSAGVVAATIMLFSDSLPTASKAVIVKLYDVFSSNPTTAITPAAAVHTWSTLLLASTTWNCPTVPSSVSVAVTAILTWLYRGSPLRLAAPITGGLTSTILAWSP